MDIACDDGQLKRVYLKARPLKGLQEFAASSPGRQVDDMIYEASEALSQELNGFLNRGIALRGNQESIRTQLSLRQTAILASKTGLTRKDQAGPGVAPPPTEYDENTLEDIGNKWRLTMDDFSDELIASLYPGTAVTSESWTENPPFADIGEYYDLEAHMELLDIAPIKESAPRPQMSEDSAQPSDLFEWKVSDEDKMNEDEEEQFLEGTLTDTELVQLLNDISKRGLRKYNALSVSDSHILSYVPLMLILLQTRVHCLPPMLPARFFEDLATEPREWQVSGATTIHEMLRGPLRTALLGDGMGLGKTLTAITIGLQDREKPFEGTTLVVVQKALVSTWVEELKFHFKDVSAFKRIQSIVQHLLTVTQGKAPTVLLIDDTKLTTADILGSKYDFAIVTYHYLCGREIDLQFAKEHGELLSIAGPKFIRDTMKLPAKYQQPLRTNHALDKEAFDIYGYQWKLVILDEAQLIKNASGEIHAAVRRLTYLKLLMLSGTFMPNKWHDVWGFLDLFPTRPFASFQEFIDTFGTIKGKQASETCKVRMLAGFLDSFIIARPQNVLKLKGLETHEVSATLSEDIDLTVMFLADQFYKMAVYGSGNTEDASGNAAAMSKYIEAALMAFCPLVARRSTRKINTKPVEKWLLKRGLTIANATPADRMRYMKRLGKKVVDGDDSADEDYRPDDDKEGYVPGHDDGYEETEDDVEYVKSETSSNRGPARRLWLKELAETPPDHYVDSPRVAAGWRTVHNILNKEPDAKITYFSKFLRVLDVMHHAINHSFKGLKGNAPRIIEYNGSMSLTERDRARKEFQQGTGPVILLITIGAGGLGITLTASHHVVMSEYLWTVTEELQALSRCYRQGQEKVVHVWRITSPNDTMLNHVKDTANRKIHEINRIRDYVVRSDPGCCTIEEEFAERFFKKNDWPDFEWADGVDAINP